VGLVGAAIVLTLTGERPPPGLALAWAALAGVLGVSGLAALYQALADGLMTLVSPIAAVIAAGVPAAVGLLAGEALSAPELLGLICALFAVVMVSLPRGEARLARRELLLALGAGLGFAGFYLGADQAEAGGGGPWWIVFTVRLASMLLLLAATAALAYGGRRPRLALPLAVAPILLLAGLGDLGGNLFVVLALATAPLSVTAVVSSLYPVVTILLAAGTLGERLGRLQGAGVGLALLGIVLIAI
jgi:drug/metabolite transporter (DMT)-like permease